MLEFEVLTSEMLAHCAGFKALTSETPASCASLKICWSYKFHERFHGVQTFIYYSWTWNFHNLSVNICCSLKLHEQFMEFKFLSVQTPTRMMEFKLSQSNYESLLRLSMIHGAKPLSVQTWGMIHGVQTDKFMESKLYQFKFKELFMIELINVQTLVKFPGVFPCFNWGYICQNLFPH